MPGAQRLRCSMCDDTCTHTRGMAAARKHTTRVSTLLTRLKKLPCTCPGFQRQARPPRTLIMEEQPDLGHPLYTILGHRRSTPCSMQHALQASSHCRAPGRFPAHAARHADVQPLQRTWQMSSPFSSRSWLPLRLSCTVMSTFALPCADCASDLHVCGFYGAP